MTRRKLVLGAVGTGDFLLNLDGSGSYTMNLHLAEGVTAFCRTSVFYQAGSEPKRISFGSPENGDWIEFRVEESVSCVNSPTGALEVRTSGSWAGVRTFYVYLSEEADSRRLVGDLVVAAATPYWKHVAGASFHFSVCDTGVMRFTHGGVLWWTSALRRGRRARRDARAV